MPWTVPCGTVAKPGVSHKAAAKPRCSFFLVTTGLALSVTGLEELLTCFCKSGLESFLSNYFLSFYIIF